jgi:chaperone modulatory protein CbpM
MYLSIRRSLPARSRLLSWTQLVEMTSMGPARVAELVELEWIRPVRASGGDYLFRLEEAYRMAKLERLCRDLGVDTLAGTIIVDLIDRVESLESRVRELQRLI